MCRSVLRLDVPAQATVVRADPDAALRDLDEPVLVDEWQLVPEVLGAVKRAVDDDPRPGRFILTGSSQTDLTTAGWPATGRIVRLTMHPLVGRERHGDPSAPSLIDRILADGSDSFSDPSAEWDVHRYVAEALTSGWPEALRVPTERARDRWLTSYVDHLVTREAAALGVSRDPVLMRRYLQALAANTAGVPNHKLLYDAAGITRHSAVGYDDLLDTLMITQRVPAWAGNRMDRAVRLPKRYLTDPGLLGPLLRIDQRRVLLLIGARDGQMIAVEVKATAAPSAADARHLEWFAERVGSAFAAGIILHTGPRVFRLAERILAVPIASLWA